MSSNPDVEATQQPTSTTSESAVNEAAVDAFLAPGWEMPARGDRYLQIRISRNTSIAIIFSLLVHLLLLITLAPQLLPDGEKHSEEQNEITVNLAPPPSRKTAMVEPAPAPAEPVAEPQPAKPPKPSRPKVVPATPKPDSSTNKIIALEKPSQNTVRPPLNQRIPAPTPPAPDAPTDMQSYIAASKAKRQAEQGYTPRDSAEIAARDNPMSEDDKRDAIIKRNLKQEGGNGIFQLRELRARSAQFSFKGWKNDYTSARQELVDVEAGPDGDINRAIVKKMIAIIRRDYNGDFNWESQRLGRTVILSARQEDNAGLEDFLIKEFFGVAGISAR